MYSLDKPYSVYTKDKWYSWDWDGCDYGRDFDENKSFFEQFRQLRQEVPVVALNVVNSENSEFNNNIINSKNCLNVFNVLHSEDCSNLAAAWRVSNVANSTIVYTCEWKIISSTMVYESSSIAFSVCINACNNLTYCTDMLWCNNCFWCVWLKHKSYCFFNTQYSQEEYYEKVNTCIKKMKLDREWGQIFPADTSLFGYNESLAQDDFPLKRSEAKENNFNWSDYEAPFPSVTKTIPAEKLPDTVQDIPDDILNWAIVCEMSWKPFKITAQELEFYRKHNLPCHHLHPDERHLDRLKIRTDRRLHSIACSECDTKIQSTYSEYTNLEVLCRECYNKKIF